ncbi:MarR family winged helix-turn-helix transcriptional regulator [Aquabacter cavernae]|uniref:MarR family winged helix-turn-helix transcriptional regulator n=1 Tax=Aquabacter cavernae TaxID=2496029 RepID=UPI000F8E8DB2|nr:MarR family transcriptional regulator [Aquabacter cavernae]
MAGGEDRVSTKPKTAAKRPRKTGPGYVLDTQVGFLLRQVNQRHTALFSAGIGEELTPTQWAALAKLHEKGPCSQNLLGRHTAMDAATIKGVVDRMVKRGLVETRPDPEDGRRLVAALTAQGSALAERLGPAALAISQETLAPLDADEQALFVSLLERLR